MDVLALSHYQHYVYPTRVYPATRLGHLAFMFSIDHSFVTLSAFLFRHCLLDGQNFETISTQDVFPSLAILRE